MGKPTAQREAGQGKPKGRALELVEQLREELKGRLRLGVLEFIEELFEEERRELIGEPWSRKGEGQARSGGTEEGSVYLEGRRVPVVYPRIRDAQGSRALPAYAALRSYDLMAQEVQAKLVRGVSTRDFESEKFLAVIDGAKALRAALLRRWGGRVVIARCQLHKKRNVLEHLPPKYHADIRRRLSVAYGMTQYEEALSFLKKTVEHLRLINEDAAKSLEEGMEETLTVVKLGLPEPLRKTFSTTNPLESVFDQVRYRTGRVKRWRNGKGQMVLRWTAAAALETERRFHKVKGHKLLSLLAAALNGNQLDTVKEVG